MSKSVKSKILTLLLAVLILTMFTVGGSLAYIVTHTDSIKNVFNPSTVTTEVQENFDGTVKRNITVENTGDIKAYVRVKLVTYRVDVDKDGNTNHIGGTATIPDFTLGTGWFKYGDCYYYTTPVPPGDTTQSLVGTDGITLQQYTDADGGKQVIEVMAEGIQAGQNAPGDCGDAVKQSWGVVITSEPASVTEYKGN